MNPNRSARQSLENLAKRTPAGWNVNHDESDRKGRYPPRKDKQHGHSRRHEGFDDRWDEMSEEEQQAIGANKRDVWTIATQPYAGDHFATFPEKLVETCILAGTPVHGVCAECGAPWARMVERSVVPHDAPNEYGSKNGQRLGQARDSLRERGSAQDNPFRGGTTRGWWPTCAHGADAIPATILDPFCGSGTAGVVALRHQRSFVGIELNPEYVQQGRRRIFEDAPLFNGPYS